MRIYLASGSGLNPLSVPFGPINNIQQTFNHPQAIARGVIAEVQVVIALRILIVQLLISVPSTPALERSSSWAPQSHTMGRRCR